MLGGRYRLLEKIGEGGAAEVYRAIDERLDRVVAIKLLRPQFTSDPQSRNRFIIEARAAAALSHPNIVDTYDFGEGPNGTMYIAMQYVDGENLKDILQRRGRLPVPETVSVAQQVCSALSVAHAHGLIHRDVKPQNIMVDRNGNVHLTDFGVVKALSGPQLTQSGMTFGTAAYLSPEQATGEPIGPASDIYALGCLMYEMLSGQPPFTGDNPAVVAYKQVWQQPSPLHDLVPDVPPSLEAVVMRCLSKEPDKRYQSAEALSADLDRFVAPAARPSQAVARDVAETTQAMPTEFTPVQQRRPAEVSQAIPMPVSSDQAPTRIVVPPVRAPIAGNGGGAGAAAAPVPAPVPAPYVPAPNPVYSAPTAAYVGGAGAPPAAPPMPVVNVRDRQRGSWLPLLLLLLALLAVCGFFAWQGRNFLPVAAFLAKGTPSPPAAAGAVVTPTATTPLGSIIQGSPVTGATSVPPPTNTPVPPTPVPPTNTPAPQPPTDTPAPAAPTDTPASASAPTDTPVLPIPGVTGGVSLSPGDFSGGYTRTDGMYHGRPARWVYGAGTQYSTMTAGFNVDSPPLGPANLTIVGVDSEDPPKTPIRIMVNSAVIYEGPDPLPNDNNNGPFGPGNWGTYTWQVGPGIIQQGANTVTIANLDPSDKVNYPIFFMISSVALSWGP